MHVNYLIFLFRPLIHLNHEIYLFYVKIQKSANCVPPSLKIQKLKNLTLFVNPPLRLNTYFHISNSRYFLSMHYVFLAFIFCPLIHSNHEIFLFYIKIQKSPIYVPPSLKFKKSKNLTHFVNSPLWFSEYFHISNTL
jgi:hypothetical protein